MNSKFEIVKNMVIMFSCLIIGCTMGVGEVGRKFDVPAANQIEVGKTTEAEVIALLGNPNMRTVLKDGSKIYGYYYGESKVKDYFFVRKLEMAGDVYTIMFDKKGVVSAISTHAFQ